jgi:hypothetical protein
MAFYGAKTHTIAVIDALCIFVLFCFSVCLQREREMGGRRRKGRKKKSFN